VSARGKRRRWTAEQKHKIVAEGMEPDVSAAMVARRHGISTGQFYAWRQQLLLRRALDAGADCVPNLAVVEPVAVLGEHRHVPHRRVHRQTHEPAV
jgi:transposase